MLGLGAVAAPVVAKAVQAEAAPVSAVAVNAKYRDHERYGHARDLLAAQREINRRHSAMLSIAAKSRECELIAKADWA